MNRTAIKAIFFLTLIIIVYTTLSGCISEFYHTQYFTFQYDTESEQLALNNYLNQILSLNDRENVTNSTFCLNIYIKNTDFNISYPFHVQRIGDGNISLEAIPPDEIPIFENFTHDTIYNFTIQFSVAPLDNNIVDKIRIWDDNMANGTFEIWRAHAPFYHFDAINFNISEGNITRRGRNIIIIQLPITNEIIFQATERGDD